MKKARRAIDWDEVARLYRTRTQLEWLELDIAECACRQKFYVEWEGQTECRDCLSVAATLAAMANPYLRAR